MEPQLGHIDKSALLGELEAFSGHDFKASVMAAELTNSGLHPDALFFRNQSTFRRAVSKDVEDVFWNNGTDEPGTDYLIFELNREGIYDMLPEAVVHTQARRSQGEEAAYKAGLELRRQERDARKFFSPLENEFHHRSLKLDMVERELLKNDNPRRNREFFNYFFEDSSALSDQQLLVLLHILPLSHKIRGNTALIGLTLSRILGYKVRVTQQWAMRTYSLPADTAPALGVGKLGTDTVLNELFTIPAQRYEVCVMNVPAAAYKDFSGKGRHMNVLNFILPCFFAANADYQIILNPHKDDASFRLTDESKHSFLGFNSYI
jgi:hypothetical protein